MTGQRKELRPEYRDTNWLRLAWFVLGLGLLGLVLAGRLVEPSPEGFATHQALGLPPCLMHRLFGMRCPSCGMTTAWAWVARGNLYQAARASVSGTYLMGLMATTAVVLLGRGVIGREIVRISLDRVNACLVVLLVLMVGEWLIRVL